MTQDNDGLSTGALLLGGGVAGYALWRWLQPSDAAAAPAASPTPMLAAVAAAPPAPASSPPVASDGPVSSPSQVDPPATSAALSRRFDPIFERYRGAIPIEYLRALSKRESSMRPRERSGPGWGLMQVVEVVRNDYNEAHGTSYTRTDLLDPAINVAMACWVLRFIIASYQRNHPNVPNLQADWDNPQFLRILTFGWNAGFSEKAGVGCVVRYLEKLGATDIDLDQIHDHAGLAGASRHLSNDAKVRWCKSVVTLYERERAAAARNAATVTEGGDGRVTVTGSSDYVDHWIAFKGYFADKRGFDLSGKTRIPRTTNADVLALAPLWDAAAAKARTDVFGVQGAIARWREAAAEVVQLATGADPAAVYPQNLRFWKTTNSLAVRLQVAAEEPPDVEFVDALVSNVEKLPSRIASVGDWFSDAASGAAGAAGGALEGGTRAIARGLTPLLKPIAIGAGILGAGVLIVVAMNRRSSGGE